jgi:hypothetical protein
MIAAGLGGLAKLAQQAIKTYLCANSAHTAMLRED